MAQENGYYIDVKAAVYSGTYKRQNGPYSAIEPFFSLLSIGSAFEHAVLEQLMGSDNAGASTIKLIHFANSQGNKIFWANSANFSSVQSQIYSYDSQTLNDIQADISSGSTVILPANGQLAINQWRGTGYVTKFVSADRSFGHLGMVISGGYYGGFVTIEDIVNPGSVWIDVWTTLPDISFAMETITPVSQEPVDMATGAYLSDHSDISLGGNGPMGLAFGRSYNSSRNRDKRSMGYGWQNSYDIFLRHVSDGDPCLGMRTPVDAAAMITNLYVTNDLLASEDNITGWTTTCLSHKWAIDQLIDNAVSVNVGGQVSEYIKLPDGSYNSPPGFTTQLIDNGNGTFSLKERFGTEVDFGTNNKIAQLRDIDGNALSFTYSGDRLSTVHDAAGRSLSLNYSGDNLVSVTDSTGRSVAYDYDGNSDLVGYTDTGGRRWSYVYDAQHQMTSLINPLSVTTATNVYDALGRVKTQTVPRQSGNATYNFYFSGFRNVEEDPYGKRTAYYLDKKGRTYKVEDALLAKTEKTFDGQNHALTIKNARSYTTKFAYDGNQNLIKLTDALNKETNNSYDLQFHLTDTTDSLSHITHFDYDSEHHLIQTIDSEDNSLSMTYYANGLAETTTDGRGVVTMNTYDSNNNPMTSTTASHPPVRSSYDAIGRMLRLTDQEGAITFFTYDDRGLLLTSVDPLGKVKRFGYDDAGRLISSTDRNGSITTYSYTTSDKLSVVIYPDASRVTLTYDLHDKLTSMQDSTGTTAYTYDAVYRLKSVTNPYSKVISYDYDAVGNVTKITYPDGKTVIYTYDALNRLKTAKNWLLQTATYNYDAAGRLTSLVNFNGSVTNYGYDTANRLTSLQNKKSGAATVISSYAYTLDGNGNKTQVLQEEPLVPVVPMGTTDYTYNAVKNRLLGAGSTDFSYDDEGQLASKGSSSYTFDYAHRLKNISGNDSIQFQYDGAGNRLEAIRNGVTTRYIYDARGNVLAETDSTNAITRYYVYGLGLLSMVTPANQVYTYHYNGIGSTIAMTRLHQYRGK